VKFVTSNLGKVREAIHYLRPLGITVMGENIPYVEVQADTLEEVVTKGIEYLSGRIEEEFIIEDSGLFIDALSGFPGVYSAYVQKTIGNSGILRLMEGVADRRAEFRSCIGYWDGEEAHLFTGRCQGTISPHAAGEGGFGYDPIFIPDGDERTFAEMSTEEKNRYSHRGRAFELFVEHIGRYKHGGV